MKIKINDMKKLIVLAGLLVAQLSYAQSYQTPFQKGWKDGYKAGYCYDEFNPNYCITPVIPLAPYPQYGKDTYQDGYNRGFLKGKCEKTDCDGSNGGTSTGNNGVLQGDASEPFKIAAEQRRQRQAQQNK